MQLLNELSMVLDLGELLVGSLAMYHESWCIGPGHRLTVIQAWLLIMS